MIKMRRSCWPAWTPGVFTRSRPRAAAADVDEHNFRLVDFKIKLVKVTWLLPGCGSREGQTVARGSNERSNSSSLEPCLEAENTVSWVWEPFFWTFQNKKLSLINILALGTEFPRRAFVKTFHHTGTNIQFTLMLKNRNTMTSCWKRLELLSRKKKRWTLDDLCHSRSLLHPYR